MIICKACGHRNPDDEDFCASCGRYLEWAGERVDPDPEPELAPEPQPEPEPEVRPGWFTRARTRLGFPPKPRPATEPAHEPVTLEASEPLVADSGTLEDPEESGPPDTIAVPVVAYENGNGTAEQVEAFAGAHVRYSDNVAELGSGRDVPGNTALLEPSRTAQPRRPGDVETTAPSGESNLLDPRADRGLALRRPTDVPKTGSGGTGPRRQIVAPSVADLQSTPSPGDVFCPNCGQFNSPTRVYCRRCGTELPRVDDDVQPEYVPIPFFKRHFHRDAKIVPAGTRPGHWGRAASGGRGSERYMRVLTRLGAVLIGAGVVLSFIGPVAEPLRNWYSSAYRSLLHKVDITYTQQFAIGADATTTYPNHAAGLAVDDADNTYWLSLPSKKVHGAGQSITAVFAQPTTINYIGILAGAGPSEQNFLSEARPKQILVSFPDGTHKTETLQDVSTFQKLNIHDDNAASMTIKVLSIYPSSTGNAVAITEIEFFQRS